LLCRNSIAGVMSTALFSLLIFEIRSHFFARPAWNGILLFTLPDIAGTPRFCWLLIKVPRQIGERTVSSTNSSEQLDTHMQKNEGSLPHTIYKN
jgi:hypothetical protein